MLLVKLDCYWNANPVFVCILLEKTEWTYFTTTQFINNQFMFLHVYLHEARVKRSCSSSEWAVTKAESFSKKPILNLFVLHFHICGIKGSRRVFGWAYDELMKSGSHLTTKAPPVASNLGRSKCLRRDNNDRRCVWLRPFSSWTNVQNGWQRPSPLAAGRMNLHS